MTDSKTIAVYDSQVDDYAAFAQDHKSDPVLEAFVARLNADDYVLDLGCGPAQSSAMMREHGLRVDPMDASEQMVKLANDTFDIGARQAAFTDVDEVAIYDGIWANFSLLHASAEDFPKILSALRTALKPDGILHLGMKTGAGSKRDKLDRFYSYYSEEELRAHLEGAGFVVVNAEHGEGKGLAGNVEPWIVMLSSAG